jgi:hypothetical protein
MDGWIGRYTETNTQIKKLGETSWGGKKREEVERMPNLIDDLLMSMMVI